jgi:hypothetical protein
MHALSGRKAKRARRRAPGGSLAVPPGVTGVTDARLGTAHLVTHEAMVARARAGGRYVALCGCEVLAANPSARHRRSCPCYVAWFVAWRYRLVDPQSAAG